MDLVTEDMEVNTLSTLNTIIHLLTINIHCQVTDIGDAAGGDTEVSRDLASVQATSLDKLLHI